MISALRNYLILALSFSVLSFWRLDLDKEKTFEKKEKVGGAIETQNDKKERLKNIENKKVGDVIETQNND